MQSMALLQASSRLVALCLAFFKPTTLPGFVSSTCLRQGHGILFGLIASHLLVELELQAQQILFRKAF